MQKKEASRDRHRNTSGADAPEMSVPVIGIGASAGGLEALKLFLENVPENSGMAYVVVQHLDPTRKGFLVDLLKRATPMPVLQVEDRTAVRPDCVFVIPPNRDMSLFHGVLHLFEPAAPRGLRLPVDFLFRSLADDRREHAIGVILSGMGTDGTLGLKAIKEKGGLICVQKPDQAGSNGMPRSAINTGLVDIVASAEDLPSEIISYLEQRPLAERPETDLDDAFDKIVFLLRSQTGHDFSLYKKTTVYRRIERRLSVHKIDDLGTYIRFLQENPQELKVLFKELLIGVTSFFRDAEVWQRLKERIVADLLSGNDSNRLLRAWVPGCSTGEEAYSLAIVFREAQERAESAANISLQIFATDLDHDAIEKARRGFYEANIAADISPERLRRFFTKEKDGYLVDKDIRDMVIFAPHNVIMDPPFTKIDILSCRNLLIYLTSELQKKLLALFHHSLNPGGILLLGSAETADNFADAFERLEGSSRLYRRLKSTRYTGLFEFPYPGFRFPPNVSEITRDQSKTEEHVTNLEDLANQIMLQHYCPAAVLVNDKGDILYTRGRVGKYLEPTGGKANWNVFAMAAKGLRYRLSKSFQQACRENSTVVLKSITMDTDGGQQMADITIHPLAEPEAVQPLVMVVFTDVRVPAKASRPLKAEHGSDNSDRVAELEHELEQSHQEMLSLHRDMQSYQEELLSAHEELQSTNEELQSTNEELTTSKEELQSLNEELQTVNYELQMKVDGLSEANNDLKNLLESTDIATLFLDKSLCVRRFTVETSKIIKLIPSDVGRPITDVVSDLTYPELAGDAREVLRTLVIAEREVPTGDGRWFSVRIMPYRTLEDKIDGLVITFTDITKSKTLEAALRETQAGLEKRIASRDIELDSAKRRAQSEVQQDEESDVTSEIGDAADEPS